MAFNFLLSDDIFISYSHRDAATYAPGLADKIMEKGLSCFYDRLGTDPNRDLPPSLKKKIRGCRMFVLLATDGAAQSPAVEQEIEEFLKTGRTSRIVPVDVDGSLARARWLRLVEGIAPEVEKNPDALCDGNPSPSVVSRVEKSFRYLRGKDKLRAATAAAALILSVLLIAIGWSVFKLRAQQEEAAKATRAAALAKADAAEQQRIAEEQGKKAAEATALAQSAEAEKAFADAAKVEAVRQQQAAEQMKRDAEKLRDQARAEALRQGTIAGSRKHATESRALLLQRPEEVPPSLTLAKEALEESKKARTHLLEADTAIRASLALFPHLRSSYTYAKGEKGLAKGLTFGDVRAVALSPDGLYFASINEDNKLRVYKQHVNAPASEDEKARGQGAVVWEPLAGADFDCQCSAVALSSGATYAAAVLEGGGVEIFNLKDHSRSPLAQTEADPAKHIALSPGGQYVALTADLGQDPRQHSKVWVAEVKSGTVITSFDDYVSTPGDRGAGAKGVTSAVGPGLDMLVNDVAFGPTGDLAVAGIYNSPQRASFTGRVVVWKLRLDADAAKPERELTGADFSERVVVRQEASVATVAPGTDDTYFATDTGVWKRVSGVVESEPIARWGYTLPSPLHSGISKVAFSPDGRSLTLVRRIEGKTQKGQDDDEVALETWDAAGYWEAARAFPNEEVTSLGFRPDGELIAAMPEKPANERPARVFRAADGKEADGPAFGPEPGNRKIKYVSPRADYVVYADEKVAVVRDVWSGREMTAKFDKELTEVDTATVSPGGGFLALSGTDKKRGQSVAVYYLRGDAYVGGKLIHPTDTAGEDCHPDDLSLSQNGQRLALRCDLPQVWDAASGRDISPEALKDSARVIDEASDVLLSPDGRFLAVTDTDGWPYMMDLSPPRPHWMDPSPLPADSSKGVKAQSKPLIDRTSVRALAFSRDGRYLGLGSDEGILYVFDTRSLDGLIEVARLQQAGQVTAVAFSDDDRHVAAASSASNPFNKDESHPLRVWLLRPEELLDEARSRLEDLRRAGR